tara:strand:- start:2127 stop:3209 length:1083 start_codon:yes stop_codon:yes gene_type:complete
MKIQENDYLDYCQDSILGLPVTELTSYRNEVDRFGFSRFLQDYFNLNHNSRAFCHWLHGWNFAWRDININDIGSASNTNKYLKSLPSIVYNDRIKNLFEQSKFRDVRLGPLPFTLYNQIYGQTLKDYRPIDYLILLPKLTSSSVEHINLSTYRLDQRNIEFITSFNKLSNEGKNVVFCLYYKDIGIPLIRDYITKNKLKWIHGANPYDRYSLQKMHKIFALSKVVYTNVMGSGLVYAAICGAKVGISHNYFYKEQNPQFKNINRPRWDRYHNLDYISSHYSHLLCSRIEDSKIHKSWAIKETGGDIILEYGELLKILGWNKNSLLINNLLSFNDRLKKKSATIVRDFLPKINCFKTIPKC